MTLKSMNSCYEPPRHVADEILMKISHDKAFDIPQPFVFCCFVAPLHILKPKPPNLCCIAPTANQYLSVYMGLIAFATSTTTVTVMPFDSLSSPVLSLQTSVGLMYVVPKSLSQSL